MKIFKFPGARMMAQDFISTAKNRHGEKDRDQGSKSPKLSQFKKSGSLDLTCYQSKRNKQLQRLYRASSCEKKLRNKSSNSSKSVSQYKGLKTKPSAYKLQNPKKELFFPEKKIFLQTEKKPKYHYNDLKLNIDLLSERLARCLDSKSQKLFTQEYSQTLKMYAPITVKQNSDTTLNTFIQKLCKCEDRKHAHRFQLQNQKINSIQKQKTNLNVEFKRIKIKEEALNNQIKKLNDRNMELSRELKKLKEKEVVSEFTQTQKLGGLGIDLQDGDIGKEFPKLIQQLRSLQQKERHMSILVGQLQRDGLNLQKIYKKGVKFMKNAQKALQNSSQASQDSQEPSSSYNLYLQQQKSRNPRPPRPPKQKTTHSSDADNSIIDQIDALSLNYENEDKYEEIAVFEPKRVYACQKEMDGELKKRLALNFQCLYQEGEEESGSLGNGELPTI